MESSARDGYLATEVLTAPPQKLQLMMIEGAIRFAAGTRQLWSQQRDHEACESLLRAQETVGQLLASIDREAEPQLTGRAAAVYMFIFRCLLDASLQRDQKKLDDAVRVLEVERETWRQVCEKLGMQNEAAENPVDHLGDIPVPLPLVDLPAAPDSFDAWPVGGFSLEA